MVKVTSEFRDQCKTYIRYSRQSRYCYRSGWVNIISAFGGFFIVALYGFPLDFGDLLVYIGYLGFLLNLIFACLHFRRHHLLQKIVKSGR